MRERLQFNRDFIAATAQSASIPANPPPAQHQESHQWQWPLSTPTRSTPLYAQIITAGTHKASSIKVAEAAKVIENTQRDINIALMNE